MIPLCSLSDWLCGRFGCDNQGLQYNIHSRSHKKQVRYMYIVCDCTTSMCIYFLFFIFFKKDFIRKSTKATLLTKYIQEKPLTCSTYMYMYSSASDMTMCVCEVYCTYKGLII